MSYSPPSEMRVLTFRPVSLVVFAVVFATSLSVCTLTLLMIVLSVPLALGCAMLSAGWVMGFITHLLLTRDRT